jgi:hypothetical protein
MNLPITVDSLVSGFIGAFVGVFAAFLIHDYSNWRKARQNLRDRLLELRCVKVFVPGDPFTDYRALYNDSFTEVWKLFLAYRDSEPFFRRARLDEAWLQYKGQKKGRKSLAGDMYVPPITDEETSRRVDCLLRAIGHES